MKEFPNIPEIALIGTAHNEKALIFVLPEKSDADKILQLFNEYSISWGDDGKSGYRIRLIFSNEPEIVNVWLTKELSSYNNIDWLLKHEVNCVSVGYRDGSGKITYPDPFALNYQGIQ